MILSGFMIVTAEISNFYSRKRDKSSRQNGEKNDKMNDDPRLITHDRDFMDIIEDSS